jgi:RimJ/RimL family protein N-acetyltransferase
MRGGPAARLRPILDVDYQFLIELESATRVSGVFRSGGGELRPEHVREALWVGVLTQYVIESVADGTVCGLVTAYDDEGHNGLCSFAVSTTTAVRRSAVVADACEQFLDHLFGYFRLRKVYCDTNELHLAAFGSTARRLLQLEVRFPDAVATEDGGWMDRYLFSLDAKHWSDRRERQRAARLLVENPRQATP